MQATAPAESPTEEGSSAQPTGYDHAALEAKWQQYWRDERTFATRRREGKDKKYVLDMFPYPSGAGLHVGHPEGYTASDIMARYWRMRDFDVLHPMGWDSFGLPAEQHAINTGTHPEATTKQNIANFKRQLQSLGFSYDWERELATTDIGYVKWTQWIFVQLFKTGEGSRSCARKAICSPPAPPPPPPRRSGSTSTAAAAPVSVAQPLPEHAPGHRRVQMRSIRRARPTQQRARVSRRVARRPRLPKGGVGQLVPGARH
eukprot:3646826-Prymnesium_polylepis.1